MSEPLAVWLRGERVGTLMPTRRGATFRYDDEVIARAPGLPLLSTSMPVGPAVVDAELTRPWFSGLLPEDAQLDEVRRRFDLLDASYIEVLAEIGWECAGAVVIAPESETPPVGRLQPLPTDELAVRLAALPAHPFEGADALRVSLGGFQAKLLVTRVESGWALPLDGAISTHILKPQPRDRYPLLLEAEAWAMTLAAGVTATASVEVLRLPEAPPTLMVERFDREIVDGALRRIHQEDAAQAMGLPPANKYASARSSPHSGPTLRKIAVLLERYALDVPGELDRLLEQVTVNVALGNTDAHAKNYGVMHPGEATVSLSPMYDVLPAIVVNPAQQQLGMRVDEVLVLDRVTKTRIVAEAQSWGMPAKRAGVVVERTLAGLSEGFEAATERLPDTPEVIVDACRARVRSLLDARV